MTRLDSLQISGFKGIDEVDIETTSVNIITGRNNAGKTSLLEAIDLLFNPDKIKKFEDNIDSLIHEGHEECVISCEYIRGPQLSLDDFGSKSETDLTETRTMKFEQPHHQEAADFFLECMRDLVETGPDSGYIVNRFTRNRVELDQSDQHPDIIEEELLDTITGYPIEEIIESIIEHSLVISIDGESYPYIYLGNYFQKFRDRVVGETSNKIENSLRDDPEKYEQLKEVNPPQLERILSDILVPRFGSGRFVSGSPPILEGVEFNESIKLDPNDIDLSKENAAVRLSNIEDYVKEHNLVENLSDLSLDTIVFHDGSNKHQVPYDFMGDGLKSLIGILWELSDSDRNGNVLMLEEPGQNMHPGYVNNLAYRITTISKLRGIQLFLTTHNIDLIRSFLSETLPEEEREFLEEELTILQMSDGIPQEHSYDAAKMQMDQLQLDLRSI